MHIRPTRVRRVRIRAAWCGAAAVGAVALTPGRASRGPTVIPVDRFNYNASIAHSMQEQLLLNIVRMRYGEAPFFLDVASVVQQYSRQIRADATGLAIFNGSSDGQAGLGVSGTMSETPTITYRPILGSELVNQLVQPIPASVVIILMAHGWEARELLLVAVERLNDLRNPLSAGVSIRDIKQREDFLTVLDQLTLVQTRTGLRVRAIPTGEGGGFTLRAMPPSTEDPDIAEARRRFRELLDIDQDATFTEVVTSPRTEGHQIAIETRSVMSILSVISRDIAAPAHDVEAGRAYPGRVEDDLSLVRITSSQERPADAYISVRYRGTWFSVPDDDMQTKRVFALLQMLLAVQTAPERSLAPLITVGAGG